MKNPINHINKAFESRVRLGIMSILMVNEEVDFNTLKEYLQITDGNLASHIKSLENSGMVEVKKQFMGRKPNTRYTASAKGRAAFTEHLNALENLIRNTK